MRQLPGSPRLRYQSINRQAHLIDSRDSRIDSTSMDPGETFLQIVQRDDKVHGLVRPTLKELAELDGVGLFQRYLIKDRVILAEFVTELAYKFLQSFL